MQENLKKILFEGGRVLVKVPSGNGGRNKFSRERGGALLGSLFFVMVSGVTMLGLSQFQQSNLQRSQQFRDQRMLDQLGAQIDRAIQSSAVLRTASYSGRKPPEPGVPFTHLSAGNRALYRCWRHDTDTLDTVSAQSDCEHMIIHEFVVPRMVNNELTASAGLDGGAGIEVFYTGRGDRCLTGNATGISGLRCSKRKSANLSNPPPLYKAVAQFRAHCPEDESRCSIAEFIDVRFLFFNDQGRRVYPRGKQGDESVMPWETISTSTLKGQQCNEGALAKSTKNNHLQCECVFPWQPTGEENINGEVCFRVNIQTQHECDASQAVRGFDPKPDSKFGKERAKLQCLTPASSRTRTQNFKGNAKGGGVLQGQNNGDCESGWVQSAKPVCDATCRVKKTSGEEPDWYKEVAVGGAIGAVAGIVLGVGLLPGLLIGGLLSGLTGVFSGLFCGIFGGCETFLAPCAPKVECSLEVTCQDFQYNTF